MSLGDCNAVSSGDTRELVASSLLAVPLVVSSIASGTCGRVSVVSCFEFSADGVAERGVEVAFITGVTSSLSFCEIDLSPELEFCCECESNGLVASSV